MFGNDLIGSLFTYVSQNVTGNDSITAFLLLLFMFFLTQIFKLPIEITALIMLPLVLVMAIYLQSVAVFLGGILFIVSIMTARHFLTN
jgi:hypothetical protein